jgi:hypothetical protein
MERWLFNWPVKHLPWLAKVPALPQLFDACWVAYTAIRHPERLRTMEAVEAAFLSVPGVTLSNHRFGGVGFILDRKELGHLHGNGLLDLYLGRTLARGAVAAREAECHHLFGDCAWVSVWIDSMDDMEKVQTLISKCLLARN